MNALTKFRYEMLEKEEKRKKNLIEYDFGKNFHFQLNFNHQRILKIESFSPLKENYSVC